MQTQKKHYDESSNCPTCQHDVSNDELQVLFQNLAGSLRDAAAMKSARARDNGIFPSKWLRR